MRYKVSDVARAANVSAATVSRVLNGVTTVGPEIRRRVIEAVTELDYQPNSIARSLKVKRTNTIAVVVSDISNPFFTGLARQVEYVLEKNKYDMLVASTDSKVRREIDILSMLDAKSVDGIILSPESSDLNLTIRNLSCPVIAVDRRSLSSICDSVYVDKGVQIEKILRYLFSKGHRNIAMVTGSQELSTNKDRFIGYCRAFYDLGLEINTNNIIFGDFSVETGRQALGRFMELGQDMRPTAVVTGNSLIAAGVLSEAKKRGVRIPNDLSIVSSGEISNHELIEPQITYVRSLNEEIGRIAAELMLDRIKHPDMPIRTEVLDADMCEGNSVRAVE